MALLRRMAGVRPVLGVRRASCASAVPVAIGRSRLTFTRAPQTVLLVNQADASGLVTWTSGLHTALEDVGYEVHRSVPADKEIDLVLAVGSRPDAIKLRESVCTFFQDNPPPTIEFHVSDPAVPPISQPGDAARHLQDLCQPPTSLVMNVYPRIEVKVLYAKGGQFSATAVSHVTLLRTPMPHPIVTTVTFNDFSTTTINGDGIQLLTPLGSWVYGRRAGGALIDRSMQAFELTALNSTSLSFRPLVIPTHVQLAITFGKRSSETERPLTAYTDSEELRLSSLDEVLITGHPHPYMSHVIRTR